MKSHRILLFIAIVIALLGMLCAFFPKEGVRVADTALHFPSLTQILNPERQMDVEAYLAQQDSLAQALEEQQDSIDSYRHRLAESDIRFWFPNDDDTYFDDLFAAMERAKKEQRVIRVLHYGDSQIEMDRMSDRLRTHLQERFGGGGPGLIPFATIIPSRSVNQYSRGGLVHQSPWGDSTVVRANGNYGIMLQDFRVTGGATATVSATNQKHADNRVRRFSQLCLLFNNRPGPLTATLVLPKQATDSTLLTADSSQRTDNRQQSANEGVQAFRWQLAQGVSEFKLSVEGTADLYGILVDDGAGVAVDNIPLRGSSGQQFMQVNESQLATAYGLMDIGLVILQFGGNAVPYLKGEKGMSSYCNTVRKMIGVVRRNCPKAKILFIGPSDMCTSVNGQVKTYPYLPTVVDSLRATATAQGAAYWSIYDAMGGMNSMKAWAEQGLGGADYLHFSQRGADIMGDRLAQALENMYQLYLMRSEDGEFVLSNSKKIK